MNRHRFRNLSRIVVNNIIGVTDLTPIICSAVVSALQTISAVVAGRGVLQRNYKLDEHRIDREVEFVSGGIEDQIL